MIMVVKSILKGFSNIPGWRTRKKIVVFESDDWGSLRMPNVQSYLRLNNLNVLPKKGIGAIINRFDTLETSVDLELLFDILYNYKDSIGNSAKFTALSLVANPDFKRIRESNYSEYHYELITETFNRFGLRSVLNVYRQGNLESVFFPQFHGREHLNVQTWLRALQRNDKHVKTAFDYEVTGIGSSNGVSFQAAFDLELSEDLKKQEDILIDGVNRFNEIFGCSPDYFVPPNGKLNCYLEKVSSKIGIKYLNSPKLFKEALGEGMYRNRLRFLGNVNKSQQLYLTRNAFFEPYVMEDDAIQDCLRDISLAFMMLKPAIISTHRVNYVSGLDINNRDKNLRRLKSLLEQIVKRWPDVIFMSSSELGREIESDNHTL